MFGAALKWHVASWRWTLSHTSCFEPPWAIRGQPPPSCACSTALHIYTGTVHTKYAKARVKTGRQHQQFILQRCCAIIQGIVEAPADLTWAAKPAQSTLLGFPMGTEHPISWPQELPCFQDSRWLPLLFFLRQPQAEQGSCRLLFSGMDLTLHLGIPL